MEEIPLSWEIAALVVMLVASAFFSIAETSMMALNRYRLKHLVGQGHGGARRAAALLGQTHRLLGVILLGNNLVNAGAATLVSLITIQLFGENQIALGVGTLVLESSTFMPKKHISILLNLFDLGAITVQDIMLPRARIESITLADDIEAIARQLGTSYHMRLPVFRDSRGEVVGVLHLRKVLSPLHAGTLDKQELEALLAEPYFVPAATPVLRQMQYFQEHHERIALVVDEYGELMGLVTLEDIIEEIIGKFTTTVPSATPALGWAEDGTATADGAMPVREVNRALGLNLPIDGPKTLNGLILEQLQDIPEADVSVKIAGVPLEIVHAQGRAVKTVRIFRPKTEETVSESAP